MKKILLSSYIFLLVGCVNYKDTFNKNLNSTAAYVVNGGDNTVSMFAMASSTFALTSLGTIATGTNPMTLTMHPTNKFAYVVNNTSATISVYSVSTSTRKLTLASTTATGVGPIHILFDSSGTFAYVNNSTDATISAFSVNTTTGALTSLGAAVVTDTSPLDMVIVNSYLYVATAPAGVGSITSHQIASNGMPGSIVATNGLGGPTPLSLNISSDGTVIYAPMSDNTIGYGTISTGGTIGAPSGSVASNGTTPVGFYINSTGGFAYSVNSGSANLSLYTLSANVPTYNSLITVATTPVAMSLFTSGGTPYAFVVNSGSNNVQLYSVNNSTGALTLSATTTTGTTPRGIGYY